MRLRRDSVDAGGVLNQVVRVSTLNILAEQPTHRDFSFLDGPKTVCTLLKTKPLDSSLAIVWMPLASSRPAPYRRNAAWDCLASRQMPSSNSRESKLAQHGEIVALACCFPSDIHVFAIPGLFCRVQRHNGEEEQDCARQREE